MFHTVSWLDVPFLALTACAAWSAGGCVRQAGLASGLVTETLVLAVYVQRHTLPVLALDRRASRSTTR